MALKVELKPGERLIVGECVITNADQRTRLLIEGHAPILREKDILTSKSAGRLRADSPNHVATLSVTAISTASPIVAGPGPVSVMALPPPLPARPGRQPQSAASQD